MPSCSNQGTLIISTLSPDDIASINGEYRFEVYNNQIVEVHSERAVENSKAALAAEWEVI